MSGPNPHVLYVAWGFPPSRSGGVYRALATANAFAGGGWDVTVLTADRESWDRYTGSDPELETRIDPRIDVVRIPFEWPRFEHDLRRWPASRVWTPRLWARQHKKREHAQFPENHYGPWRSALERAALDVHARKPVDLAVATANPNVDFTAPWLLKKRFGVPMVMDYRDAWALNTFTGGRLTEPDSRAAQIEREMLHDADEVWFVNDPITEWHQAEHPGDADRMITVMNGWDAEFDPGAPTQPADPDRPLCFGYVGTVTPVVPMREFLDGWRAGADREPLRDAHVSLRGYLGYWGTPSPELVELIDSASDVRVAYEGPVSRTALRDTYATFDVLLLLQGPGRYITGGKVFDYLSTARPIVSVQDPDGHANDLLRDYPLWFPAASFEPADVADALEAAAVAARADDPERRRAAYDVAQQYRRDRQLAPRVAALRELVSRPRPQASEVTR